jgi:hypothetical protein
VVAADFALQAYDRPRCGFRERKSVYDLAVSVDLALWKRAADVADSEYRTYVRVCEGDASAVIRSPDVLACREAILRSQPHWNDVVEPGMDPADELDRYLLLTLPFSWADAETIGMVVAAAATHGLVLFDPQTYDGPTEDDEDDDGES